MNNFEDPNNLQEIESVTEKEEDSNNSNTKRTNNNNKNNNNDIKEESKQNEIDNLTSKVKNLINSKKYKNDNQDNNLDKLNESGILNNSNVKNIKKEYYDKKKDADDNSSSFSHSKSQIEQSITLSNSSKSSSRLSQKSVEKNSLEIHFPDFYELDEINTNEKIEQENLLTEVDFLYLSEIITSYGLVQIPRQNFESEKSQLLYKHRDFVYKIKLDDWHYIKKISLYTKKDSEMALNELSILKDLRKSELFFLHGICLSQSENSLYIIFDSYNTSLPEHLNTNHDYKIKILILKNLLKSVLIFHSKGIIHRDIKPELIFLDKDYNVKIFDYYNAIKVEDLVENPNYTIFYTPRFIANELSCCDPRCGWAQDIFSLGCCMILLFLDYKKYDESTQQFLLHRIFYHDSNQTPKIPKDIEQEIASNILKCISIDPLKRIDIIALIERFNSKIFKYKANAQDLIIDIQEQGQTVDFYKNLNSRIYLAKKKKKKTKVRDTNNNITEGNNNNKDKEHDSLRDEIENNDIENINNENNENDANESQDDGIQNSGYWFEFCGYHREKDKQYYCSDCNEFYCEFCIKSHQLHFFVNVLVSLDANKKILEYSIKDIGDEKFIDTNFIIINELKKNFEFDYQNEKSSIKKNYQELRQLIDNLEKVQLEQLESSKNLFLGSKFQKLFKNAEEVGKYYKKFYEAKRQYHSCFSRIHLSLANNQINLGNFVEFCTRFEKFCEYCEILKKYADILIVASSELRIPGKYIFRNEQYTQEMNKSIRAIETRIGQTKHIFFEYAGNDSLFLSKELLMIIPLTNCIFSYQKNTYKKIQVNFDMNSIKIKTFLPGCATLHFADRFYISGGELNDEGTRNCYYSEIQIKTILEIAEMNYVRRYHTMVNLLNKYILVLGGWSSNECEVFEVYSQTSNAYWNNLMNMKNYRADATCFLSQKTWLYVFGGWDYEKKECIFEIERLELLDSDQAINYHNVWETVKLRFNKIYIQKYNMGIIPLGEDKDNEKLLLIGGFDDEYDYSDAVVHVDILKKDGSVIVSKDIKGLPKDGETSFWYEKSFHIMENESEKLPIAVNFNCFNNIYVYTFSKNQFKLYTNTVQNKKTN